MSPNNLKNKLNLQHKSCKGTLHGTGNYCKPPPQNDNQSIQTNGSSPKPEALETRNGNLGCKKKSSSVSSEGFSESDSVDSEKNSKNGDVTDGCKKSVNICERLHAASTKASHAKTAKMRYLEEADDEDILWIEDLVKGVAKADGKIDKENRNKKREVLKKVLGRKPSLNGDEAIKPSKKIEEIKDTTNKTTVSNFTRSTPARSSFSRGSFRRPNPPQNNNQNQSQKPQTPTPPPRNLRGSFRNSIRRNIKKKSSLKIESISYDELVFRATNKKVNFLSFDRNNCLKDLKTLMSGVLQEQEDIKVIPVQLICIFAYVTTCGSERLWFSVERISCKDSKGVF